MKYCTLVFILVGASMLFGEVQVPVFVQSPEIAISNLVVPADISQHRQEDSLYYCSLTSYTGIGLTSGGSYEMAIRLTPTQLAPFAGYNLIGVVFYHYDGSSTSGNAIIYDEGTATTPGTVITTEPYSGITGWQRVDLTTPVPITGATDLWCSFSITHAAGGYPGGVDGGPMVTDAGWIYYNGTWATLASYGLNYNWQILAIVEQGGPSNLVVWDFETGWQNWVHTNGQTFPFGWGVMESHLNGNQWICPTPGDSSLWFDDNAAGGNSYLYQDSVLSPILIPDTNTNWLSWGVSFRQRTAGEWLEVGLKYYNGSTWIVGPYVIYVVDAQAIWDSMDVSAYKTYPLIQVYCYYDDGGGRGWYGTVDNVSICGTIAGGVEDSKTGSAIGTFGFAPGNITHTRGHALVTYIVDRPGRVSLKSYDETGALVATIVDKENQVGLNAAHWDCSHLAAGVYFLRLEAEGVVASTKLVVIK
jgi:hypothetical protein